MAVTGCTSEKNDTPIEKHILTGEDIDPDGGADSFNGSADYPNSKYWPYYDYYNMESNDNLTFISKFKTFQQTTENSCGAASAYMVSNYYGVSDVTEEDFIKFGKGGANGVRSDRIYDMFDAINFDVQQNKDNEYTFESEIDFTQWVQRNLSEGTPIVVCSLEWAGHWQVIIGYDTMGTAHFGDDVLIMADSYDVGDHYQDGYLVRPAITFFYSWKDGMLPGDEKIFSPQSWVIAKPKKSST